MEVHVQNNVCLSSRRIATCKIYHSCLYLPAWIVAKTNAIPRTSVSQNWMITNSFLTSSNKILRKPRFVERKGEEHSAFSRRAFFLKYSPPLLFPPLQNDSCLFLRQLGVEFRSLFVRYRLQKQTPQLVLLGFCSTGPIRFTAMLESEAAEAALFYVLPRVLSARQRRTAALSQQNRIEAARFRVCYENPSGNRENSSPRAPAFPVR